MKYLRPHIIVEGSLEYKLGELKSNHILYDFEKILIYLNAKGKTIFGQRFKIYEKDRDILYKLCNYQIRNYETCKKLNLDLKKGILLSGPIGCGKTSLIKLIRCITPHYKFYEVIPARNIVFTFNHLGYSLIEQYGDHRFYCFDDIGAEPYGRYFGKDCNVMGEILLSRYELFQKYKFKTHCTTNLNAQELEIFYGNRIRSKMRELFNLIAFDRNSSDKRK